MSKQLRYLSEEHEIKRDRLTVYRLEKMLLPKYMCRDRNIFEIHQYSTRQTNRFRKDQTVSNKPIKSILKSGLALSNEFPREIIQLGSVGKFR